MEVRKALLRGQWYPETEKECIDVISSWEKKAGGDGLYIGGIVPHAGWFFSGEIASMVIEKLAASKPELVIIFGFHMHSSSPVRVMSKGCYETPLGDIKVFEELVDKMAEKYDFVKETPDNFEPDNTIEVQLPLIKYHMENIPVFSAGLPPNEKSLDFAVSLVKEAKKFKDKIVVIGSTDLTHYGPGYGFAPVGTGDKALDWVKNHNDKKMVDLFKSMGEEKIINQGINLGNACCCGAAAGAVAAAKVLGAKEGVLLNYTTSFEKSPGDSFVGYAGVCFK